MKYHTKKFQPSITGMRNFSKTRTLTMDERKKDIEEDEFLDLI